MKVRKICGGGEMPKSKRSSHGHTSMSKTSEPLVKAAERCEFIEKIVLGYIKHIGGGRRELKFKKIYGGTMAIIRGDGMVQKIIFYTSRPEASEAILRKAF